MFIGSIHFENRLFLDVKPIITYRIILQEVDSEPRKTTDARVIRHHLIPATHVRDVTVDVENKLLQIASDESIKDENRDVLLS